VSDQIGTNTHQSANGCYRLESKTMAIGHFLVFLPVAKTAGFANSLMEKDQIARFCLY